MNKILFFIGLSTMICITACEHDPISRVGFNAEFNPNSTGLTMMHVGNNVEFLNLTGKVDIELGNIIIELVNPHDQVVESYELEGNKSINIYKSLPVEKGFWKLRYRSDDGLGTICLYLYQERTHNYY